MLNKCDCKIFIVHNSVFTQSEKDLPNKCEELKWAKE